MSLKDALDHAVKRQQAGDMAAAESIYRQILAQKPDEPNALQLLAVLELQRGAPAKAAELFERALRVRDDVADTWSNYAIALGALSRTEEAKDAYEKALTLAPDNPVLLVNYGGLLQGAGDVDRAIALYRRAVKAAPGHGPGWFNLGHACLQALHFEEAAKALERALEIDPEDLGALKAMVSTLAEMDRLDEAAAYQARATELAPQDPEVRGNEAVLLEQRGQARDALAVYDALLAAEPGNAAFRWNRGLLLLKEGDYAAGFEAYVHHRRLPSVRPLSLPEVPYWQGEDLKGKSVAVLAEQGLGDMVQFARFLPALKVRGAQVTLESYKALTRLFEASGLADDVVQYPLAAEGADYRVPVMSVPHLLGTTLETLPAEVPYLSVPAEAKVDLPERAGGLRVGLVWSSNPQARMARRKSLDLSALAPLTEISDVAFYSLQVGQDAAQLREPAAGGRIADMAPQLTDLAATASAISQLDLVISIDTVVAHLAGALGAEVWTLLPAVPDWRWMTGRTDSPWYPTMRLFRQPAPGEWGPVVADLAAALRARASRP